MIEGLRSLGARIDSSGPVWTVEPLRGLTKPARIDCGLAGTVMRFLPPVAALGSGTTTFFGDAAASARPMAGLVDALQQLGAVVSDTRLPITVTGPISHQTAVIDSSASSQFISALLLTAPRMPHGLSLTHDGAAVPSAPHIAMTIEALRARGVLVEATPRSWMVQPTEIAGIDEVIEPDLTTAAVFLAAALVAGGTVTIPHWPTQTTQPGQAILEILTTMGGHVTRQSDSVTVQGTGTITGIDIDLNDASELTPVVAGLAGLARSDSVIRGVGHIRGHETDRLAALSHELTSLGCRCEETADGLRVHPGPIQPGVFHTHADHRLAHTAALLGLASGAVKVDDVACTSKTMPEFATVWEEMVS
jgi:3-phosphoshikimate 1-carboxyvinyltransferase